MEKNTLENALTHFFTNIFKGILYSVLLGCLGIPLNWVVKWPFPKGSYVLILAAAIIALFVAVVGFVGTPTMRFAFFTRLRVRNGKPEEIPEEEVEELGQAGVSPAIIGVVMLVIGFVIEALTH